MKHLLEYLEFDELSKEASQRAIEEVREEKYDGKYGGLDIGNDVVDNDSLFEPPHQEMSELFGDDYYEENGNAFMIENGRDNIAFVGTQDPNYYLQCAKALNVTNDNLFFRWLKIPPRFWRYISYNFKDSSWSTQNTKIEFEVDEEAVSEEFGDGSISILDDYLLKAEKKFDQHIKYVLDNISSSIDWEFDDSGIIDTIERFEIKFTEEGDIDDSED